MQSMESYYHDLKRSLYFVLCSEERLNIEIELAELRFTIPELLGVN